MTLERCEPAFLAAKRAFAGLPRVKKTEFRITGAEVGLTLRTRGKKPQPLFSLDDIRKLIHRADVKLHVAPDAVKWLQMRASTLGTGGLGRALACFYLASKVAFVQSADTITAQNLEDVTDMTMGDEDAQRVAEVVAESSGMRRVV